MEQKLNQQQIEQELLKLAAEFLGELNRTRQKEGLTAFSKFEQDLGIDSLGRVEMFHRIEEAFQIELPESLLIEVQTLHDLAAGMANLTIQPKTVRTIVTHETTISKIEPENAVSLTELLINRAQLEPDRQHIIFQDENGQERTITYGHLYQQAARIAANLQSYGIEPGDTIALMLPTNEDFFPCFMGILLCGAIAVPIYPPLSAHKIEEYAMREAQILKNAEARILITFDKAERLSELLKVFIFSLKAVVTVNDLKKEVKPRYAFLKDNRPALIQYTSGSTSLPKGVLLSHQNLIGNVRSVGKVINFTALDCAISWLPLYHDMGLIGAWFSSFYHGNPVVIMSPISFLTRPERWLWAMHYHRGTISAAPNFAFELCYRRIKDEQIKGLDLSSMRLILNGAEKVNPKTLQRFSERFAAYGLKPEVLLPVYGLAESTVGLCIGPINRKPKIDVIERDTFEREQRAVPTDKTGTNDTISIVSCGTVLPEHAVRIVDEQDNPLPERQVGFLHFKGPSTMLGYYQQEETTRAITHGDWTDSGDLAYIADNEVYITGRKKDVIIKAGRNLYPEEIEEVSSQVDHVRKGCVIAFGVDDSKSGTEHVVVVAEVKDLSKDLQRSIMADLREKCATTLGIVPDEVVLVAPKTIPKTSSGKLQRSACKASYISGELQKKRLPAQLQMVKLFAKGLAIKLKNSIGMFFKVLYNGYVGLLLFISGLFLYLISWLFPYRLYALTVRYWARSALFVIGCRLKIIGNLPLSGRFIYVANHASYIDAVILVAALPPGVMFVGKKELLDVPILSRLLKKFKILTVDRMDFLNNQSDLERISQALKENRSLTIFPEGTFTYATGLRGFKFGAFKVAVETQTPICPVALAGTRSILRGDEKLLALGSVTITVSVPMAPQSSEWAEVMRLHDYARQEIAKGCGEQQIDY